MYIQRIDTSPRMSRVVVHNNTAYLCGQVAEDSTKDITHQTETMLSKVDSLLASVGSDKSNLLSVTIYVKNMSLFQEMNDVWDNWVPAGNAPARACVEAKMASPDLLVEISIIAAIKQ